MQKPTHCILYLRVRISQQRQKTIIFTIKLMSVLLYGLETWTMTTRLPSKIQAAEVRVLRMIGGVTRLDGMKAPARDKE